MDFFDIFNSEELSDVLLHINTNVDGKRPRSKGKRGKKAAQELPQYSRSFSAHAMILYQSAFFKVGRLRMISVNGPM